MTDPLRAQLLQCPSCAAPIQPKGIAAIVTCPYCQTSVIVPEALRESSREARWNTFLFDSFMSNENKWTVGTLDSEYFAPLTQSIAEGRYRWDGLVRRPSSMSTAFLPGYRLADLNLIAHTKHVAGSRAGSGCGVLFRVQDNRNYMWYRITDHQHFSLSVVVNGEWFYPVDWTRSDAIQPYGVNQLAVLASGAHFVLSINGQIVAEADSGAFAAGHVGLAVEGYDAGEHFVYDFLDLTLRAP